ncbi:tigger transposable element-derived protein 1-like [Canis lupus familiaris]|uniref:tigger transposable element-derived protein 1-like n=1 Tax=Canis lupus dingo TaxID=286419 RepID=UPI0006B3C99B|nr:tigger transposable element-derived protein 1-like [Canis lupus dingo]XP_038390799.1 tigger transposable element-derived protein 1-like [Canis lupus familiaris]XP_038523669.1 tigger transposable element-derived protein 1-like [Canis lupus familiaris]
MPLRILMIHEKSSKYQHEQGVWKKLIPILMDELEGFRTSVKAVTADAVETVRELEVEGKPEDRTEWLQSHNQTFTEEELLLMDEQKKFLELKTAPGEDAVKTVEMTIKD